MTAALDKAKRHGATAVAAISEAELAVRICEALNRIKRPHGSTAEQALNGMDADQKADYRRAAVAAMEYWRECISSMRQTT